MELPPYRFPSVKSILRDSWEKGEQYLRKIGTTILLGSIIIWALSYFPRKDLEQYPNLTNAEVQQIQQENSFLGQIGKGIEPVVRPLGFDWKTGIALLTGVAAKEVVISTLSVLYQVDSDNPETELAERLKSEKNNLGEPIFTPAVALSLMLFVLIYFPCIATLATIKHETGHWKWALFAAIYTILLAWLVSFTLYQLLQHNLWQQAIVTIIILITGYYLCKQIIKIVKDKNKGKGCKGCDLK